MKIDKRFGWLCVAAVAVLMTCGCGGRAVVPSSYDSYKGKVFQVQYPAGWKAEGGGSGPAWATFSSGSAKIEIETGLAGSLVADIAQSQNRMMGIDSSTKGEEVGSAAEDLAPVRSIHEMGKEAFLEKTGYKEKDPTGPKTGLGSARKSEFSGSATFGGAIHGYRVTALSLNYAVYITCTCPEEEWQALKPVFDKVIVSIAPAPPSF